MFIIYISGMCDNCAYGVELKEVDTTSMILPWLDFFSSSHAIFFLFKFFFIDLETWNWHVFSTYFCMFSASSLVTSFSHLHAQYRSICIGWFILIRKVWDCNATQEKATVIHEGPSPSIEPVHQTCTRVYLGFNFRFLSMARFNIPNDVQLPRN